MMFPSTIDGIDRQLFFLINTQWTNALFDAVMPFLRGEQTWYPLFAVLAAVLLFKYKINGLIVIGLLAVNIIASDQISSSLIKPIVQRDRPCQNEEIKEQVRLLVPCGVGKSFTSSHATNYFAFATLMILLFTKRLKKMSLILVLWAGSIAYAQVYVGVHYPFDVICGAIMGTLIGALTFKVGQYLVLKKRKWVP